MRFVILPIISSEIYKSRRLPSFFGAFYSFSGEKVLSLEQKNFLCFKKRWKKRYFRSLQLNNHFQLTRNRLSLRDVFRTIKTTPTIFFVLCNPVLYGWIFLHLAFTQWMTGTYSVSSPKQRLDRERQNLWNSVCFA